MKVREPVARPTDVIVAELALTASQAFVVGVLLYLAVGMWDERGIGTGSMAAILVVLALAVGVAWLYWLLGGHGLPLAAAAFPVALFLGFAALLGWLGDGLVELGPLALLAAFAAAVYGVVAGVFLDSPRRLRWDQRKPSRRAVEPGRLSPATAAWVARVRKGPRASSRRTLAMTSATTAGPASAGTQPVGGAASGGAAPDGTSSMSVTQAAVAPTPRHEAAGSPSAGSQDALVTPTFQAIGSGPSAGPGSSGGEPRAATPVSGDPSRAAPVELPTSVEPRAQRSPWAWARPPEWNRDDELDDDHEDGRA